MNLKVTTVSRKPERLWSAPSGIDVVTDEDIRRAGVLNLPDALRLATGVHVGQPSARSWAISIRGMNVLAANKVSVVMDGRSLFTPFFSGVQWDAQDTLLEDIDRIEVISGPGATLWGANAVNGVINVITKRASDTQGTLATAGAGNLERGVAIRHGVGGEDGAARVYGKYWDRNHTVRASGANVGDEWHNAQTGFRADWSGA
ncbi:MAG TPA: TonB-dependent receptor plug domain-containing protein, partial [Vicinamibacteria bacterium]|nr:TonB-dependent receptor plug domain-containing protein [Vicinamibacteria bacterium]